MSISQQYNVEAFLNLYDVIIFESTAKYQHQFGRLEELYEGAFRPGHFRGVGEVVHILFELVQPDAAFFGEKDFQQLQVIRRLVEIMGVDIDIVGIIYG